MNTAVMIARLNYKQNSRFCPKMVTIQNAPIWRQQQSVILLFKSVMAPSTTVRQHHEANVSKQDIKVAAALSFF